MMQKVHFRYILKKELGELSKVNVGYSYHLSLHTRDRDLILDIQKKLNNVGSFYEYDGKTDVRIAVNDKSSLIFLIENLFNIFPLITRHQLKRYLLLREVLLSGVTEFKTLDSYNEYILNCSFSIDKLIEDKFTLDYILNSESMLNLNIDN